MEENLYMQAKTSYFNPDIFTGDNFYHDTYIGLVLFVLRFYSAVNPLGPCRTRSVYLTFNRQAYSFTW